MTFRVQDIDGSKVFLGFDGGAIANVTLPEKIGYAREEPEFPEFSGRFAPPLDAMFIAAVCWNSPFFDGWGQHQGYSGHCDIRHAYFLSRSPILRWSWLLLSLSYDDDNELWQWLVVVATDRAFESERDAAKWLLETFWYWEVDRIGKHATAISEIGAVGLLTLDQVREMGERIFPARDGEA